MGIGTPWKAALLLAAGAVGGVAAVAVASVPDGNGVVHACVELQNGTTLPQASANLRVIDGTQTCTTTTPPSGGTPPERSLDWNVTGPAGPPGTNGTNGSPGAPGKSVTIAAGNELTLPGGQVIKINQSPGLTINPPALGTKRLATLTLTGNSTITANLLGVAFAVGQGGANGSGKGSKIHDISITKTVDKSSPKLYQACVNGTHFKKAVITLRRAGHTVTYTLGSVLVSSAQVDSVKGRDTPTESLSLNFTNIEIKYN